MLLIQMPLFLNCQLQEQNGAEFLWAVNVFLPLHCKYNNKLKFLLS